MLKLGYHFYCRFPILALLSPFWAQWVCTPLTLTIIIIYSPPELSCWSWGWSCWHRASYGPSGPGWYPFHIKAQHLPLILSDQWPLLPFRLHPYRSVLIGCMQMLHSYTPSVLLYHFEDRLTLAQYFACLLHWCFASRLLKMSLVTLFYTHFPPQASQRFRGRWNLPPQVTRSCEESLIAQKLNLETGRWWSSNLALEDAVDQASG